MNRLPSKQQLSRSIALLACLIFTASVAAQEALPSTNDPVAQLEQKLKNGIDLPEIAAMPFAQLPLTRPQAEQGSLLLWNHRKSTIRRDRAAEMNAKQINIGKNVLRFDYQVFGKKPMQGRSLYISMHGGGGAPPRVNDSQWENQKRLYQPTEGVYVAPRAPTDTWNLWHQPHIDDLFARLIEDLIVFEEVDPDRVYLMGYSAGGDGVYQLAPRMADRFAAAAMMAGHPNESSPLGLRNLPFTIHVGQNDSAYDRNRIAAEWETKLNDLHQTDPGGYQHDVQIHQGKGHWMDRQDAVALNWMAKYTRNLRPEKIVWKQDDVRHHRFYWLSIGDSERQDRSLVVATHDGQHFDIKSKDIQKLTIRVDDSMIDFDQSVSVTSDGKVLFEGKVQRTLKAMIETLSERGDPRAVFTGEIEVEL